MNCSPGGQPGVIPCTSTITARNENRENSEIQNINEKGQYLQARESEEVTKILERTFK